MISQHDVNVRWVDHGPPVRCITEKFPKSPPVVCDIVEIPEDADARTWTAPDTQAYDWVPNPRTAKTYVMATDGVAVLGGFDDGKEPPLRAKVGVCTAEEARRLRKPRGPTFSFNYGYSYFDIDWHCRCVLGKLPALATEANEVLTTPWCQAINKDFP
jgi:hypothetical protein